VERAWRGCGEGAERVWRGYREGVTVKKKLSNEAKMAWNVS
jgi:hypothetical protein